MLVSLDLLKAHVRADDFAGDDAYLTHLAEAAEAYVWRNLGRSQDEVTEMNGGTIPPDITQAILLIAGHWYNQREGVSGGSMSEVPYTIGALLKPYQRLS